jgi:hypothetical protein
METKKCCNCKELKILSEFNKNKAKKDGYNTICRVCSNLRSKKYYEDNVDHHKKVIAKRKKKILKEVRKKIFQYYKENPCVICGENDPIVLEFDHREKGTKIKEVSSLVGSGWGWETIKKEIEKCDVMCANCHRRKTAKDFGWYKDFL